MTPKPTLLIVDDEPFNLDLLEQELEEDYALVKARNGAEALERADTCNPDLILMDVMMPGITGIEAVKRLRASERHVLTPVILLTAEGHIEARVKGLDAGADDYVIKPFEPDELHARIRSALRLGRLQKDLARERNSLKEALAQL